MSGPQWEQMGTYSMSGPTGRYLIHAGGMDERKLFLPAWSQNQWLKDKRMFHMQVAQNGLSHIQCIATRDLPPESKRYNFMTGHKYVLNPCLLSGLFWKAGHETAQFLKKQVARLCRTCPSNSILKHTNGARNCSTSHKNTASAFNNEHTRPSDDNPPSRVSFNHCAVRSTD